MRKEYENGEESKKVQMITQNSAIKKLNLNIGFGPLVFGRYSESFIHLLVEYLGLGTYACLYFLAHTCS